MIKTCKARTINFSSYYMQALEPEMSMSDGHLLTYEVRHLTVGWMSVVGVFGTCPVSTVCAAAAASRISSPAPAT